MPLHAALLAFLLLAAAPAAAFDTGAWTSPHLRDHPLVGRIVSGEGETVSPDAFAAATRGARFLVLGETHTNPDHHRLQAAVLAARADAPRLVFEMIPEGLQPALDAYLRSGGDAAGLGTAVGWTERGWPDFAIYRPIADVAIAKGLRVRAGDLDPALVRRVSREGAAVLGLERERRFGLDRDLPEPLRADLAAELDASHCGMMPAKAIPAMITVQRARDGALAEAMGKGPAVLIAGSGHARRDRAVPAILRANMPGSDVVSVAFVEVADGETEPADYGIDLYDYVVFTPRFDVSDPCEGLRGKP